MKRNQRAFVIAPFGQEGGMFAVKGIYTGAIYEVPQNIARRF
jgi:hypothetical protein